VLGARQGIAIEDAGVITGDRLIPESTGGGDDGAGSGGGLADDGGSEGRMPLATSSRM
jgi:hypothetical protein